MHTDTETETETERERERERRGNDRYVAQEGGGVMMLTNESLSS